MVNFISRVICLFRYKNIWLTVCAFIVGLVFQLADTTLIFLVFSVAILSSWWYWRPIPSNIESQLILDALKDYPAVIIKSYSHIIAFNSNPPCLAAAYHSPIPLTSLKRYLDHFLPQLENIKLSLSRVELDGFLLIQIPLTAHTEIKTVFQMFQKIVDLVEIQTQNSFTPAEGYRVLRLFGLDRHLEEQGFLCTRLGEQSSIQNLAITVP